MKQMTTVMFLAGMFAMPASSLAQQPTDSHSGHHSPGAAAPAQSSTRARAEGEVRRIDKSAKKITIRHGPIPGLDMPPMTMVFQVADPAVLDSLKAGDRILFDAAEERGAYVATRIERAK